MVGLEALFPENLLILIPVILLRLALPLSSSTRILFEEKGCFLSIEIEDCGLAARGCWDLVGSIERALGLPVVGMAKFPSENMCRLLTSW
jgi:hypothetical protein